MFLLFKFGFRLNLALLQRIEFVSFHLHDFLFVSITENVTLQDAKKRRYCYSIGIKNLKKLIRYIRNFDKLTNVRTYK